MLRATTTIKEKNNNRQTTKKDFRVDCFVLLVRDVNVSVNVDVDDQDQDDDDKRYKKLLRLRKSL